MADRTHYDGCWRDHHECAVSRIEVLESRLTADTDAMNEVRAILARAGYRRDCEGSPPLRADEAVRVVQHLLDRLAPTYDEAPVKRRPLTVGQADKLARPEDRPGGAAAARRHSATTERDAVIDYLSAEADSWHEDFGAAALFDAAEAIARGLHWLGRQEPPPLPMLLFCPECGTQHIDKSEPATGWTNPPHKSHLCRACGCIWRPAAVPTTGVASVDRGTSDTWGGKRVADEVTRLRDHVAALESAAVRLRVEERERTVRAIVRWLDEQPGLRDPSRLATEVEAGDWWAPAVDEGVAVIGDDRRFTDAHAIGDEDEAREGEPLNLPRTCVACDKRLATTRVGLCDPCNAADVAFCFGTDEAREGDLTPEEADDLDRFVLAHVRRGRRNAGVIWQHEGYADSIAEVDASLRRLEAAGKVRLVEGVGWVPAPPPSDAFARLRDLAAGAWDGVDVDAYMRDLRGGDEDCDHGESGGNVGFANGSCTRCGAPDPEEEAREGEGVRDGE